MIDVWLLDTRRHMPPEGICWDVLSEAEVRRAKSFRFETDRNQYLVARSALRQLLGRRLDQSPKQLKIGAEKWGKPAILEAGERSRLEFNVSHARNLVLIAVSEVFAVGVDIEYSRFNVDCQEMMERFFAIEERSHWRTLASDARPDYFFRLWTQKEGVVKVLGRGMSLPFEQFSIRFQSNGRPQVERVAESLPPREHFSLHDLTDRIRLEESEAWADQSLAGDLPFASLAVLGDCEEYRFHGSQETFETAFCVGLR